MYELMLLSRQEYVDMYATSMKDRLLAAAKAKAKELQQDAAETIEKIDKGIKGDGAAPGREGAGEASGSAAGRPTSETVPPEAVTPEAVTPEAITDLTREDVGHPTKEQGGERAAS
jgi:1-acyl-sn-glycerol-3-phosphate acyltransferase